MAGHLQVCTNEKSMHDAAASLLLSFGLQWQNHAEFEAAWITESPHEVLLPKLQ